MLIVKVNVQQTPVFSYRMLLLFPGPAQKSLGMKVSTELVNGIW